MTQYNKLNVKLSNSQLNKLKSAIKDRTEITLNLSSNIVRDSNDENNFPHKLLLTNTQVWKLRKAFSNNFLAIYKIFKKSTTYNCTISRIFRQAFRTIIKN